MRKLLYIALILMVAVQVGCHRQSETEAGLIGIDSLIAVSPDSALHLLGSYDSTTSFDVSERAYHALLTVQALYKAYIPATSDSLINIAWNYYKDHGPYDRRIRAMLYKGTTAEELGQPDSAMRWYKRTELEARPDDHYHRGYSLMKMGVLYRQSYSYKQAIKYYTAALSCVDSSLYGLSLYCTQQLGQLYLDENLDSAKIYINRISQYVQDTDDSIYMFSNMLDKSMMWFYSEKYDSSKNEALAAIRLFNDKVTFTGWYHLIISYSKLNALDSAEYYFSLMPNPVTIKDSIFYYEILQELSQGKGKWEPAFKYEKQSNNLSDIVISNESADELIKVEHQALLEYELQNNRNINIVLTVIVLLVVSGLFIFFIIKRKHKTEEFAEKQIAWLNAQFDEAKTQIEDLQNEKSALQDHVNALESELSISSQDIVKLKSTQSDSEIMKMVNVQFKAAFQNCIQQLGDIATDYYEHGESAASFIGQFKMEFDKCWKSQDFWTAIKNHINTSRNNVISRIKTAHPEITISELRLIMLIILDFDPMAIAICMGYKNTSVLYTMKNKLKKKLKTNYKTLEEYLESFS